MKVLVVTESVPLKGLMRSWGWLPLLLAAWGTCLLFAQESPPKILFLHLKLESNQVSLVSASVAPGTLKRSSAPRPLLDMEVATAGGQVLWTNNVADPSLRHLEYEDPDHPGEIIGKEIQLTNTEFTIRVPAFREADHVDFYLSQSAITNTNPTGTNAAVNSSVPQRKLVGTVTLPPEAR
jgi:hypothetical protein